MNIYKTLHLGSMAALGAATIFSLYACSGSASTPRIEIQSLPKEEPMPAANADGRANKGSSESKTSNEVNGETEEPKATANESLNAKVQQAEQTPVKPEEEVASQPVAEDTALSTVTVIDPYTVFPALADSVFAHAEYLYEQGLVDSAKAYLQRFRVIKPLWNNWENKADSLLVEFGKTQSERAKQYEPQVLQIINMNRVQTAYSVVAETADSLIAQAPGDSLIQFAKEQKQIAYNNTLAKAKKDQDRILKLAQEQAQFEEAEKQALNFQMRYRDFEDELKIQAMIESIREQKQTVNAEMSKYWETNDADKAMAEADEYIAKEQFVKAKELLIKLQASKLRKEATEKYILLADSYCNAQRKQTSSLFGKAQKQKDKDKRNQILQEAISFLDKCLTEYPETSQKKKVEENRDFLEKELKR